MTDPFRLRVLKKLTELFEGITPANGYTHDLTGKVFRGRTMFGEDDPIPLVSILEAPIQDDPIMSSLTQTATNGELALLIQGFVKDDALNPTDPAHHLMAEVKRALAIERKTNGPLGTMLGEDRGKVAEIMISSGVVRPADEISDYAYFWLPVTLKIVEDISNPYV